MFDIIQIPFCCPARASVCPTLKPRQNSVYSTVPIANTSMGFWSSYGSFALTSLTYNNIHTFLWRVTRSKAMPFSNNNSILKPSSAIGSMFRVNTMTIWLPWPIWHSLTTKMEIINKPSIHVPKYFLLMISMSKVTISEQWQVNVSSLKWKHRQTSMLPVPRLERFNIRFCMILACLINYVIP